MDVSSGDLRVPAKTDEEFYDTYLLTSSCGDRYGQDWDVVGVKERDPLS